MAPSKIQLLQDMAIFGGLAAETLEFIVGVAPSVELQEGSYYFREGDPGTNMFVLETGRVSVAKSWAGEEHVLATLSAGGCFGEMALIDFCRRSASVRALEPCTAIEISVATLHALYERDAQQYLMIQMNMGREVSRRLRAADQRLFRARFAGQVEETDTPYSV